MIIAEFDQYLADNDFKIEQKECDKGTYLVIKGVVIAHGTHKGKICDVALKRSNENPWVPEPAVHVTPHLVEMGQKSSQASPLGGEWQYLSRKFERTPTPKGVLAHVYTVLGEL